MKGVSTAIIVVAAAALLFGSALIAHDDTASFIQVVGCIIGIVGMAGWFASCERQSVSDQPTSRHWLRLGRWNVIAICAVLSVVSAAISFAMSQSGPATITYAIDSAHWITVQIVIAPTQSVVGGIQYEEAAVEVHSTHEFPLAPWEKNSTICIKLHGKHPRFPILAEGHKSRRDELLPMTPDFADWILQTPAEERYGAVFPLPMTANHAGRIISKIAKTANVKATAHDFRRSFGTRWSRQVMPAILQKLMRHADIKTTMEFYVSHDADDIGEQLRLNEVPMVSSPSQSK